MANGSDTQSDNRMPIMREGKQMKQRRHASNRLYHGEQQAK